jgi:DNA-binding NtrC family response regulator
VDEPEEDDLQGGLEMKTRVLVVDDEEQFVENLAERLTIRDYDVATALNGEDALKDLKGYNYDVIILDVLMPGIDGIETLREIKNIKPLTEVIMLTGNATVETAIEGMKLGAYDYLVKPCDTKELVAKIEGAKQRKSEQEERIRTAKVKELETSPMSVLKDKF